MATEALSAHCGGVAIFYREAENLAIKELHLHSPNFISFQMVTGRRRWHIVGCYIQPSDNSTIEGVAAAIRAGPYGDEILVAGDLNANISDP